MAKERRCVTCGAPLRDLVPECDPCAIARMINRDLTMSGSGYAVRDVAREYVDYTRKRR